MNNREVCKYVQTISLYNNDQKYIGDTCVDQGYGQSCGGYLTTNSKSPNTEKIMQKEHFLRYYGREIMAEKLPSYGYLRCPQLLLFIAEIAGLSRERLDNAYEIIKNYEEQNYLNGTAKNGNYLWGNPIFGDFKQELCIPAIVRIIKKSESWDEVMKQIRNL